MAGQEDLTLKLIIEAIDQFSKQFDMLNGQLAQVQKSSAAVNQENVKQTSILGGLKKSWTEINSAINTAQFVYNKVRQVINATVAESTQLASRFETLGVVMDVVGRNAGFSENQMEAFEIQLRETGISMIGSREAMNKMIQAELDLTRASELARVAQDAAVIQNENSTQSFNALVDAIQTGNSMLLRSRGIYTDFLGEYKKFADENDRAVSSLTAAEKAQVRLNAVIASGVQIQGSYEAAMGTAGKQINSMTRYVEDLKVQFGELFLPVYTEGVFTASELTKDLANSLLLVKTTAKDIEDTPLVEFLIDAVEWVGRARTEVKLLGEVLDLFVRAAVPAAGFIKTLKEELHRLGIGGEEVREGLEAQVLAAAELENQYGNLMQRGRGYSDVQARQILQSQDMEVAQFREAEAARELAEATRENQAELAGMIGLSRDLEEHRERSARLTEEQALVDERIGELNAIYEERGWLTRKQKEEMEGLVGKHGELVGLYEEEQEAFKRRTNEILWGMIQQKLAADGLTDAEVNAILQIGVNMGLVAPEAIRWYDDMTEAADRLVSQAEQYAAAASRAYRNRTFTITQVDRRMKFGEEPGYSAPWLTGGATSAGGEGSSGGRSQFGGPLRGAATEVGEAGTEGVLMLPDGRVVVVDHKRWMQMRGQFMGIRQLVGGGTLMTDGGGAAPVSYPSYPELEDFGGAGAGAGGAGGGGGGGQVAYRRAQEESKAVAQQVANRAAQSVAAAVSVQLATQASQAQVAAAQVAQARQDAKETRVKLDELIAEVKKGSKDVTLSQVGRQIERAVI